MTMAFHDVPGNSRIKKILKLALDRQRVPSAILFCGPKGVGKRKAALTLAKALNCLKRTDDSCDECENCRKIDEGIMPDVISIDVKSLNPDAKSDASELHPMDPAANEKRRKTIGIKTMIGLKEIARFMPMLGRKRVFIIDEADKMTEPAANAHLKILEEPPLFTHIFLISEKPALLLPTVKSRCQTLAFLPIAKEDVESVLRGAGVEEDKARIIASLVRGNLDAALDTQWEEIQQKRREAWNLFRALAEKDASSFFLKRFAFGRRSQVEEDLAETLELFASFCRDLVLIKEKAAARFLFNPDYEGELRACEPLFELGQTLRWMALIDAALANAARHLNISLIASSLYSQMIG
jgi:DNA polymerase-3 subunit delta'